MFKAYVSNGFDKNDVHEIEGEFEYASEAFVAIEKQSDYSMVNHAYVYDGRMKEVWYLATLGYGTIDCIVTLAYDKRDKLIPELVEVMEEIERRNRND